LSVIQDYKCPCCGGSVVFDSRGQNMKCQFCGTEFAPEVMDDMAEANRYVSAEDNMDAWQTEIDGSWQEDENVRRYVCQACGGEILGDEALGATTCPYCDSPIVISSQFDSGLRPELIIPFKLDKKAAKEALEKHLQGKRLLPKLFKEKKHIDEIKGIYVPFWLYDAHVSGGVEYNAVKVRRWSDGKADYTETSYFDLYRQGELSFARIPVDASSKMPDDLMDSLEPFDFTQAVDFQTAYFAGYLADKYDVSVEENLPRINTRVKSSTEQAFSDTITAPYDRVTVSSSFVELQNGAAKYALLPVWILNTTWNDTRYTFAMNGQTGKFVGDLPMDKGLLRKQRLLTFLAALPVGALIGLLYNLLFR